MPTVELSAKVCRDLSRSAARSVEYFDEKARDYERLIAEDKSNEARLASWKKLFRRDQVQADAWRKAEAALRAAAEEDPDAG